jgi:hypothetical protein
MRGHEHGGVAGGDGESDSNSEDGTAVEQRSRTDGGVAASSSPAAAEQTRSRRNLLKYGGGLLAALAGLWVTATELLRTPDPTRTVGRFYAAVQTDTVDQFPGLFYPGLGASERRELRAPFEILSDTSLTALSVRRQHDGRATVAATVTGRALTVGLETEETVRYDLRLVDGRWRIHGIDGVETPESGLSWAAAAAGD